MNPKITEKMLRCERIALSHAHKNPWSLGGLTNEDYAIICRFAWGHHISKDGNPAASLSIANRYRDNLNI